jgi:aspartyl-tRNA(Asn)/glutamyl-tRNA(Gln) amidotransferase subunit A
VLSHGYYDAYYLKAQKVRRLIARGLRRGLQAECDVIAGPTAPTVAFKLGEKADDPVRCTSSDLYTIAVNLPACPA